MLSKSISAGVARVNITPSVGFDNMGDYLRLKPAIGVGNELYAKTLVFDDGENRIAIVTADIIGFPEDLVNDIRGRIEQLTGIKGRNVLLSASHTHSSPAVTSKDKPSREYLVELAKKIAGAVYMADQNKQEVLVGAGVGEAKVSINRWQRTPTGVRWGPNPDAPVDHSVGVLRVDKLNGEPLAILVNYACHPSIMGADNLLYSGDYTSYVQSVIEKVYDGVTALFSTGAGGDVKIAVLTEDGSQFRYTNLEDCRRYGTIIAAEAIKVAESIKTKPVKRVSARTKRVDLPLVSLPSPEDVEAELSRIKKQVAELEAQGKDAYVKRLRLEWAQRTLTALRNKTAPTSIPAEVQMLRIGEEIAFFAVPGELFVEVGLKIKEAMGLPGSFVVAYANGYIGYLPSKRAEEWGWCAHDDSYKLSTRPANFSGRIEDVLVAAAKELLSES
ncbi:MAG TPA: hypothetical protein ENF85_01880 [Candidatus Bathyarchaeota archaeon]|nr:hypothetical protein [Candidatus Bathyarchaeota archaeon]